MAAEVPAEVPAEAPATDHASAAVPVEGESGALANALGDALGDAPGVTAATASVAPKKALLSGNGLQTKGRVPVLKVELAMWLAKRKRNGS